MTVDENIIVRGEWSVKKDYMTRLEGWARWMLPPQEAEDVVADYRDIVADEQMRRELGRPRDAIRPLVQKRPYYTWLAVFAVMALCVLLLGHSGAGVLSWEIYRLCVSPNHLGPAFALLGAGLALFWFRRQAEKTKAPLPKGLILALTLLLVWIGLVFLFHWALLRDMDGFIAMWGETEYLIGPPGRTVPRSVYLSQCAICYLPFITCFLALYWLVKARVGDRRWAAAYILALAAMLVSLETLALLTSMEVSQPYEVGLRANLLKCAVITAAGAAGAGVALC